jgi:hypothetical protein
MINPASHRFRRSQESQVTLTLNLILTLALILVLILTLSLTRTYAPVPYPYRYPKVAFWISTHLRFGRVSGRGCWSSEGKDVKHD